MNDYKKSVICATDDDLVHIIKKNPEKGINLAIKQYGDLVNAIIIRILGNDNPLDIQECVSDVFVKLWQYNASFNSKKGTLKSYIATIARNEALRRLKKLKKNKTVNSDFLDSNEPYTDLSNELVAQDKLNNINEILYLLQDIDYHIFTHRYMYGESLDQIAYELDLDKKCVENKLYYTKKKVQKQLIERGVII